MVGVLAALFAIVLLAYRRRSRASAHVAHTVGATGFAKPAVTAVAVGDASPRLQESTSLRSDIFRGSQTSADTQTAEATVVGNVPAAAVPGGPEQEDAAPLAPTAVDGHEGSLSIVPGMPERADSVDIGPQPKNDAVSRLIELAKLRESGLLTETEFNQLKASIIATVTHENNPAAEQPSQSE
jgi:hypothetical protein